MSTASEVQETPVVAENPRACSIHADCRNVPMLFDQLESTTGSDYVTHESETSFATRKHPGRRLICGRLPTSGTSITPSCNRIHHSAIFPEEFVENLIIDPSHNYQRPRAGTWGSPRGCESYIRTGA